VRPLIVNLLSYRLEINQNIEINNNFISMPITNNWPPIARYLSPTYSRAVLEP
jgi:hypothetical protein